MLHYNLVIDYVKITKYQEMVIYNMAFINIYSFCANFRIASKS